MLIGTGALLIIVLLFLLGLYLQSHRETKDTEILSLADRWMASGMAGQCPAYARARELYLQVMHRHFQDRDLAGKAGVAGELASLCGTDLQPVIQARQAVLAAGTPAAMDVKSLALAQLAAGDRAGAFQTLARMPEDEFCNWLAGWLHAIPALARSE